MQEELRKKLMLRNRNPLEILIDSVKEFFEDFKNKYHNMYSKVVRGRVAANMEAQAHAESLKEVRRLAEQKVSEVVNEVEARSSDAHIQLKKYIDDAKESFVRLKKEFLEDNEDEKNLRKRDEEAKKLQETIGQILPTVNDLKASVDSMCHRSGGDKIDSSAVGPGCNEAVIEFLNREIESLGRSVGAWNLASTSFSASEEPLRKLDDGALLREQDARPDPTKVHEFEKMMNLIDEEASETEREAKGIIVKFRGSSRRLLTKELAKFQRRLVASQREDRLHVVAKPVEEFLDPASRNQAPNEDVLESNMEAKRLVKNFLGMQKELRNKNLQDVAQDVEDLQRFDDIDLLGKTLQFAIEDLGESDLNQQEKDGKAMGHLMRTNSDFRDAMMSIRDLRGKRVSKIDDQIATAAKLNMEIEDGLVKFLEEEKEVRTEAVNSMSQAMSRMAIVLFKMSSTMKGIVQTVLQDLPPVHAAREESARNAKLMAEKLSSLADQIEGYREMLRPEPAMQRGMVNGIADELAKFSSELAANRRALDADLAEAEQNRAVAEALDREAKAADEVTKKLQAEKAEMEQAKLKAEAALKEAEAEVAAKKKKAAEMRMSAQNDSTLVPVSKQDDETVVLDDLVGNGDDDPSLAPCDCSKGAMPVGCKCDEEANVANTIIQDLGNRCPVGLPCCENVAPKLHAMATTGASFAHNCLRGLATVPERYKQENPQGYAKLQTLMREKVASSTGLQLGLNQTNLAAAASEDAASVAVMEVDKKIEEMRGKCQLACEEGWNPQLALRYECVIRNFASADVSKKSFEAGTVRGEWISISPDPPSNTFVELNIESLCAKDANVLAAETQSELEAALAEQERQSKVIQRLELSARTSNDEMAKENARIAKELEALRGAGNLGQPCQNYCGCPCPCSCPSNSLVSPLATMASPLFVPMPHLTSSATSANVSGGGHD